MLASFSRVECRGDESTPGPPLCTGGYPQVFPGRIFEDSPLGYALKVAIREESSLTRDDLAQRFKSKWVPHKLSTVNKKQRVETCFSLIFDVLNYPYSIECLLVTISGPSMTLPSISSPLAVPTGHCTSHHRYFFISTKDYTLSPVD
ncbi:hypothetical protein LAZ67_X004049 [Cordylochernes scorpioides]|uniref:Uncharacterized protein n=1 Tax=Cordylochernes scorpioides TaxID=51811 RepID=A0ABY6LXW1_9ARAC|nr:hypothetical protein LAZ67_X004049 [Cordylochernes scorpioides]